MGRKHTWWRSAVFIVTMSTRSPAGNCFRVAVAGGIATHAVSAGFRSRAFSSLAHPQARMLSSCSLHRSERWSSSCVSHTFFFSVSSLHSQS